MHAGQGLSVEAGRLNISLGKWNMPFRPTSQCRKNVHGVIFPLTEAIRRVYGPRPHDQALPLGAFYTVNIDGRVWVPVDGIWYVPRNEQRLNARQVNDNSVEQFSEAIISGASFRLRSGTLVTWEPLSQNVISLLPPMRCE